MTSILTSIATISAALDKLEPLKPNEYIIALGQGSQQFTANSNGYKSTYVPQDLLDDVTAGRITKFVWVSYGCGLDSYFFRYKLSTGRPAFKIGTYAPQALSIFIRDISASQTLMAGLRVQFGAGDAFVAWSDTDWVCSNVLVGLELKLRQISSYSWPVGNLIKGRLREGTLENVQWHSNGSFYIKNGDRHLWNFEAKSMEFAWNEMWKGLSPDDQMRTVVKDLAYIAISAHSQEGETFAFIKKQEPGKEVPFIVHFEQEPMHTNLIHNEEVAVEGASSSHLVPDSGSNYALPSYPLEEDDTLSPDESPQLMALTQGTVTFKWATSKKSGRPHPSDAWELKLKKGQRVKVLRDMGRDWHIAMDNKGAKGWVHGSWLDFGDDKVHTDSRAAYTQFVLDLQKLLIPRELHDFPIMKSYVNECSRAECKPQKEDASLLGICIHDLLVLLEGSGQISYEWLKEGRNVWHPDRFAQFCQPEQAERLKPMAEQMFVMYGVLMENYRS